MKLTRDELLGLGMTATGLVALLLLAPLLAVPDDPPPLRILFGWGAFVLAPALALGGVFIAFSARLGWQVRWPAIALLEALFWMLLTFIHLHTPNPLAAAMAGQGGGVVGWATAQALTDIFGATLAGAVVVAVSAVIAFLLWRSLPPPWAAAVSQRLAVSWWAVRAAATALLTRGHTLIQRLRPAGPAPADSWRATPGTGARQRGSSRSRTTQSEPTTEPPSPDAAATARGAAKARGKAGGRSRTGDRPSWLPPYDLLRLDPDNGGAAGGHNSADARQRGQLIKTTLAEFGVPVEIVSIKEGPRVTQFGLEPGETVRELRNGEVLRRRVSVASILRLQNDLALALAAPSLRIEAPVPGRPYVGVEAPNTANTMVSLRNILVAKEFAKVDSPLAIALGRDVSGDPVATDLTRMPHLLIAGATGSGKSVCINALVCSLLMNNGPDTLRMVMIDPKMVELPIYNGVPHLLGSVITDTGQATGALAWLMLQMDDRYRTFAAAGVRNIVEYNRKLSKARQDEALPYVVLIIDELADLMMTAAEDIERQICRLAQMARATGIHLVLATQRPSVDVITGLIKANFPARVAFAVTTQIDSRVILDMPGAEKLLGRGDMLFMAPESSKLARIQGCFVSDQEIERLVAFWKTKGAEESPVDAPQIAPWAGLLAQETGRDELLEQALQLLQTKRQISTSLLQRQLRIGFPRAARLMEQLEELGVVGPDEGGGRSREVLLQSEQDLAAA